MTRKEALVKLRQSLAKKKPIIGAGAGTVAFEWKGGIGTSSRVLPRPLGGYTVGVLVQSNLSATTAPGEKEQDLFAGLR